MAKGSNLLLNNMTGKVGGFVVTKAGDGDSILRSKPSVVRQPNTDSQLVQKSRFREIVKVGSINKNVIRIYTKPKNSNTSAYSTFIGNNVINATAVSGTVASLDYKKIVTVSGGGADPYQIVPSIAPHGSTANTDTVTLNWTYDANNPTHHIDDTVGIVILSVQFNILRVEVSSAAITANTATFDITWPLVSEIYAFPFFLSSQIGYGAEIGSAALIPQGATGSIISRA